MFFPNISVIDNMTANIKNRTGYLEVLVLDELMQSSKTGYELMFLLKKRLGTRPSPGSVYPLLRKMLKKKSISVNIQGRKKIYSITLSGRKSLGEKIREKEKLIAKHLELFKIMLKHELCTKHPSLDIIERIKISRKISPDTVNLLLELKETILDTVMTRNYLINEKILNEKIKKMILQIKKISIHEGKLVKGAAK